MTSCLILLVIEGLTLLLVLLCPCVIVILGSNVWIKYIFSDNKNVKINVQ